MVTGFLYSLRDELRKRVYAVPYAFRFASTPTGPALKLVRFCHYALCLSAEGVAVIEQLKGVFKVLMYRKN